MNINRRVRFYLLLSVSSVLFPAAYVPYLMTKDMGFLTVLAAMIIGFIAYAVIEGKKGNIPLSLKQRKQPWWIFVLFAVLELFFVFGNMLAPFIPAETDTWQSFITMFLLLGGALGLVAWSLLAAHPYIRDNE